MRRARESLRHSVGRSLTDSRVPSVFLSRWSGNADPEKILAGLSWVGFSSSCDSSSRIFLKPNLTFPSFHPGVMTGPDAIEAVLAALSQYTRHLFIGDSDAGGYNQFRMDAVYRSIGLYEIAKRYGATLVRLSEQPRKPYTIRFGGREKRLDLPAMLLEETDFLISIPVPKIHMYTGVSLSVKNLWGCIPSNRDRLLLHPWIGEILSQLAGAVRANFALVDGRYGLNRNGPLRGDPVELGWMMAADDLYAADRTACRMMQIDWRRIDHLRRPGGQNPPMVRANRNPADFQSVKFFLRRNPADWPGWLAFRIPWLARLAYVSPAAGLLHRLLYLVRTPFYDYSQSDPISETADIESADARPQANPPDESSPHPPGS